MKNIKRFIEVQVVKEGIHCYPAANMDPALGGVAYLANEHFHYFYITVKLEVHYNDRDVEFQLFRRYLDGLFDTKVVDLNNKSCEMIAEELIYKINSSYPNRCMVIRVFEDNINGAELHYGV